MWCSEDDTYQCNGVPCINATKAPYCPDQNDKKYSWENDFRPTGDSTYRLCGKDACLSESQACDGVCVSGRRFCPATGKCLTVDQPCDGVCPTKLDTNTNKEVGLFLCGDKCRDEEDYIFCGGKCWEKERMIWTFSPHPYRWVEKIDDLIRTCHDECITPDMPCNGICPDGKLKCDGKCWNFRDYYNEGSKINGNEARRKPCRSGGGNVTCSMFGIKCEMEDVCIEHSHVCDGKKDCIDGSDEDEAFCKSCGKDPQYGQRMMISKKHRYSNRPDPSWRYYCYNEAFNNLCPDDGHWNPIRYVCGDRCLAEDAFCSKNDSCWTDEGWVHHCNDGNCVKAEDICNGKRDCADGSDEADCQGCEHGKWQCRKEFQCQDQPCETKKGL